MKFNVEVYQIIYKQKKLGNTFYSVHGNLFWYKVGQFSDSSKPERKDKPTLHAIAQ